MPISFTASWWPASIMAHASSWPGSQSSHTDTGEDFDELDAASASTCAFLAALTSDEVPWEALRFILNAR